MACIVYKALLHLCINKYLQGTDKEKSAVSAPRQKYQWQQWAFCWSTSTVETYAIWLRYRPLSLSGVTNQSMIMRFQPIHDKNMHLIVHCTWEFAHSLALFTITSLEEGLTPNLETEETLNVADIKLDKLKGRDVKMTRYGIIKRIQSRRFGF